LFACPERFTGLVKLNVAKKEVPTAAGVTPVRVIVDPGIRLPGPEPHVPVAALCEQSVYIFIVRLKGVVAASVNILTTTWVTNLLVPPTTIRSPILAAAPFAVAVISAPEVPTLFVW
jgi:hypothetical protein